MQLTEELPDGALPLTRASDEDQAPTLEQPEARRSRRHLLFAQRSQALPGDVEQQGETVRGLRQALRIHGALGIRTDRQVREDAPQRDLVLRGVPRLLEVHVLIADELLLQEGRERGLEVNVLDVHPRDGVVQHVPRGDPCGPATTHWLVVVEQDAQLVVVPDVPPAESELVPRSLQPLGDTVLGAISRRGEHDVRREDQIIRRASPVLRVGLELALEHLQEPRAVAAVVMRPLAELRLQDDVSLPAVLRRRVRQRPLERRLTAVIGPVAEHGDAREHRMSRERLDQMLELAAGEVRQVIVHAAILVAALCESAAFRRGVTSRGAGR
jgi:hypothetical protein